MASSVPESELRPLLRLGLPAAGTQLAAMLLGVVDTMMVGRLGTETLDAAALGHLWVYGTSIFAIGMTWGMDPIMSQAHGAGRPERVAVTLHRGLVLVVLMAPVLWLAWSQTEAMMLSFGQLPPLAAAAELYVDAQSFSLIPFLGFFVLRQYLQSRGVVMPALWVMAAANLFNVAANWALVFGHLGFEPMGLEGAGVATGLTRCFTLVALVTWIVIGKLHRGAWVRPSMEALSLRGLGEIVRLGLPIGVQYGLEGWAFQFSSLMAGRLGEPQLAAHTIVLNVASLTFMLPMGLSQGAATRVGNLVGAGEPTAARNAAWLSFKLGAGIMVVSAICFVLFRYQIPRLYTEDIEVIALAAAIFPIAAAFQVFDGVQVVGGAILRGVGATRPAAIFNLVAYYGLALPVGAALTFVLHWGLAGIWSGLAGGLAIVATTLLWWISRRVRYTAL